MGVSPYFIIDGRVRVILFNNSLKKLENVEAKCDLAHTQGMTVIDPNDNKNSEAQVQTFKTQWGIPFGRPGNAVDYAQCIFGLITVSGTILYLSGSRQQFKFGMIVV